jgi:hypothetical protein
MAWLIATGVMSSQRATTYSLRDHGDGDAPPRERAVAPAGAVLAGGLGAGGGDLLAVVVASAGTV